MSQRIYQFFFLLSFCVVLFALAGDRSFAEESETVREYDRQISDAKRDRKDLEKRSEELQQEMEELEEDREQTLVYIEKLDRKSASLETDLADLKKQIQMAARELDGAEADLQDAEETEERQYSTMKRRIKYMYENGAGDYLEILFSSTDIGDLLNRTEYIEKISAYDREIFERCQETKRQITQKKGEIESRLAGLSEMQAEEKAEKAALETLAARKKEELEQYEKQLDASQEKALEYARQAAEAEAEVEKLLQKKQAEIDRQNAVGNGDSGGGDGSLRWPLNISGRISSGFGRRESPTAGASTYHRGLDIAAPSGTPIVAAAGGKVVTAAYSSSAGNYVMISHGNSLYTVYMHCSRLVVKEGDAVNAGQVIAYVGSTGISTGPHLHFGVSKNGSYVDPKIYVSQK